MPSPLLSRKCAQTLLCQTSCSGFKLLFEEYCRRFPVKCLCDPHLLKHSSPCPYLISEWCAYSEGVCRFIIPIISGILPHSPSAEWCRMNFQPVRRRSEAMRRCGGIVDRRQRSRSKFRQVIMRNASDTLQQTSSSKTILKKDCRLTFCHRKCTSPLLRYLFDFLLFDFLLFDFLLPVTLFL